jgi:hypothetical protein
LRLRPRSIRGLRRPALKSDSAPASDKRAWLREQSQQAAVRPRDERAKARSAEARLGATKLLDLLLIQVAKAPQVRVDGIYFQSLRYISTTLAADVGETVTLRFDPRDMAEIRVFHEDRVLVSSRLC